RIRPNSAGCWKRCYRTAPSIAEVFVQLTLSHSICSSGGTKQENGGPCRTRTCDLLVPSSLPPRTPLRGVFLTKPREPLSCEAWDRGFPEHISSGPSVNLTAARLRAPAMSAPAACRCKSSSCCLGPL